MRVVAQRAVYDRAYSWAPATAASGSRLLGNQSAESAGEKSRFVIS
jgi:hypothetical protein